MEQSIRSLADEADIPVHECAHRPRAAGIEATIGCERS
jgi:hypothetical protein